MPAQPVSFLGPEGTFSHLVAKKRFPRSKHFVPCADLAEVFQELAAHPGARAVVPIENSSGGTITETIDLLIHNQKDLFVLEDIVLDVRLALAGRTLDSIARIYSHFAPLQHHRAWLRQQFPGAKIEPVASTALAAELAAKDKFSAALCAKSAAAAHDLKILVFPILPAQINVTRFYVLGHAPVREPTAPSKTALLVRLKNQCGSLHSFLGPFSRSGVNLRMIVSRPIPGHPETYQFYLELEGTRGTPALDSALQKANKFCENMRDLGSFPSGRKFSS